MSFILIAGAVVVGLKIANKLLDQRKKKKS
jgi:hypothetical protein